jgi:hypothetical protein
MSQLKSIRYRIVRFFSCPCPGLQSWVPIFGGRTIIEVLAAVVIIACFAGISAQGGTTAEIISLAAVIFGMRNNVLYYLLGISFERALYWHKACGTAAIVTVIVHGILR